MGSKRPDRPPEKVRRSCGKSRITRRHSPATRRGPPIGPASAIALRPEIGPEIRPEIGPEIGPQSARVALAPRACAHGGRSRSGRWLAMAGPVAGKRPDDLPSASTPPAARGRTRAEAIPDFNASRGNGTRFGIDDGVAPAALTIRAADRAHGLNLRGKGGCHASGGR